MADPFPIVETGPGVTRRVLATDPALMTVAFGFEAGAEGPTHSHPHVQATYVASGRFVFTVAGETFEVGPGASFVVPSGAEHGCRALEAGTLVDSFAPQRDDFL